MIAIGFLVVTALYVALLLWVGYKLKRWPTRIAVLLILLSPVIYCVGTYKYVQYEHKQACAREGGLKVFIQPEKADRIQLDAASFYQSDAWGFLQRHSPRLAVVEAWDGEYNGKGQKNGYFAYSPESTITALPKKDLLFNKVPLTQPTLGIYVLGKTNENIGYKRKTTWTLTRNGQLYASWTLLYYLWSDNGAIPIGWQCFGPGSPKWITNDPLRALIDLILK